MYINYIYGVKIMTEQAQGNPLSKYFRQPILYINLPSKGKWYPNNTLDMPVTGSIPVYAMTAKDEITFKTPDALLNGQSSVTVIESCCPSIKNAWKLPIVDLDAILIAMRIATYGKQMDFTTVCPHCKTKNEHAIDLTVLMSNIKLADWESPTNIGELQIYLKPQTYEEFNKNSMMNYEEQRIIQLVSDENMDENEKAVRFNELFNNLVNTGIAQVAKSIAYVQLNDGTQVTNPEHITEFLTNCDKSVWEALQSRIQSMKEEAQLKVTTTCENPECQESYETPFVFEQSSFFE
jgi:hypothetical protein